VSGRLPARSRPEGCLSDLMLDRLLDGELAAAPELATVEAHLASCPLCQRRRDEIRSAPALAPDPSWAPPGAIVAAGSARRTRRVAAGLTLGLAAAAALALAVRTRDVTPDGGTGTRTKGGAFALDLVVRREGGAVEPVLPQVPLRPGDAIRFRVRAPGPGYLAVVGLDGGGNVTGYVPRAGEAAPAAAPDESAVAGAGAGRLLDGSVVLDDVPGDEQVIAVLCERQADAARAVEAARAALAQAGTARAVKEIALPCRQASASFRKEGRP
jgi:hypothetical protein